MSQCGGDICSNKMICMYSKAHCMSVESMTLLDTLTVCLCDDSLGSFRGVVGTISVNIYIYTHNTTALALHALSYTQSERFSSMTQAPCIVNERTYKLKTQKTVSKRMQFRLISGYI